MGQISGFNEGINVSLGPPHPERPPEASDEERQVYLVRVPSVYGVSTLESWIMNEV
jgi:hypothetical protein